MTRLEILSKIINGIPVRILGNPPSLTCLVRFSTSLPSNDHKPESFIHIIPVFVLHTWEGYSTPALTYSASSISESPPTLIT